MGNERGGPPLFAAALADFDVQALDLLVEGRERNAELLGGVGLVPVATLQLLDDDAAFDVFEDPLFVRTNAGMQPTPYATELIGPVTEVLKLIRGTRDNLKVEVGASPRAGLMVLTAAKARAALHGRPHVLPDDIKAVARPTLRHRLVLKPGAEVDGFTSDDVLDEILGRAEIPR